jgi:hypothetical protein
MPKHVDDLTQSAGMRQGSHVGQNQQPSSYCILSEREKIFSIVISSLFNFLGPLTANIYYPALGSLSRELHSSPTKINLTITAYMVR